MDITDNLIPFPNEASIRNYNRIHINMPPESFREWMREQTLITERLIIEDTFKKFDSCLNKIKENLK